MSLTLAIQRGQKGSYLFIESCQTMEGKLNIVELNGFNSCGVYASNAEKLVKNW